MCVNDIRTQELPFGSVERFGVDADGYAFGVAFFPGQSALRGLPCPDGTTSMLVPKVMGVAAELRDSSGALVNDPLARMEAYLVDNWRAQKILGTGPKATQYAAFDALLERKWIGGFEVSDPGTRKFYALGFGAGFPASTPAYGGSDNAYGVALLWRMLDTELGKSMMLIDWGFDKSSEVPATAGGGGFGALVDVGTDVGLGGCPA